MCLLSNRFLASLVFLFSAVLSLGVSVQPGHLLNSGDHAKLCYWDPLPLLPVNTEEKNVPWDIARGPNGCCASLTEVRARIDEVDEALLVILAKRAAFVREAARLKPTRNVLDVPSRDVEVIERAVSGAVKVHLPQVIARSVFTAIINSSVAFEECVFDAYAGES